MERVTEDHHKKKARSEGRPKECGSVSEPEPLRLYLQLKGYGNCDRHGNTCVGVCTSSKKIIAESDAPLALVVAFIEQLMPVCRYSTPEACARDIQRLVQYAAGLEPS